MNSRTSYAARINSVIDHIDRHLADPLDLASLAGIAHVSPWHFHRLFLAFTGETLAERVRRRRLEVAAARLLSMPPATALAIALDVGFGSAEVFTRAFRAHFDVTPSAWRRGAYRAWVSRRRGEMSKIHQGSRKPHQAVADALRDDALPWNLAEGAAMTTNRNDVELETWPAMRVAYMRYQGPYGDPGIARLWQRFEAWCRARGLFDGRHAAYGLSHDSPDITAPDKCRYDACIEVDAAVRADGDVGVQDMAGGLYACTPFRGTPDQIHAAWMSFFKDWLPASNYQPDDRPCIEAYGRDASIDPETGAFACRLCLPVRAL